MSGVVGELNSGESTDVEAGLESDTFASFSWAVGELDSGESTDVEAVLESDVFPSFSWAVGELDSDESMEAEAGLESDTFPSFSWVFSFVLEMIAGLGRPDNCEHRCIAILMRTCSEIGFPNHSMSWISSFGGVVGSSL